MPFAWSAWVSWRRQLPQIDGGSANMQLSSYLQPGKLEELAGKVMKQLILKIEFVALMIIFWGLIIILPLYNWLAS